MCKGFIFIYCATSLLRHRRYTLVTILVIQFKIVSVERYNVIIKPLAQKYISVLERKAEQRYNTS
jgi:hypothetical protein